MCNVVVSVLNDVKHFSGLRRVLRLLNKFALMNTLVHGHILTVLSDPRLLIIWLRCRIVLSILIFLNVLFLMEIFGLPLAIHFLLFLLFALHFVSFSSAVHFL